MRKSTFNFSFFLLIFLYLSSQAQVTATLSIGTGVNTSLGLNWHPIYRSSTSSTFDFSRAAFLYDATELGLAGLPPNATITAVEWDKSTTGATASNSAAVVFNILMKNSALTSYTGTTSWGVLSTGASTAYATTSQNIPATTGFLSFNLSSPFVYTGGALEILTDWDISALTGNPTTGGFGWNGGAVTGRVLGTSASTSLTGTSNLTTQSTRPNIRIVYSYIPLPTDVGMQNLVSPLTTGCYGANENVIATIMNNGTNAQSNIPVTVVVSGAVSQTLNTTFTGPLAAGASATVNVGTLNMTTAGTYSFNGFTSLAGDGNTMNDAMAQTTRTVIAVSSLPQAVSFTGYTGANLATPFPLWSEATGSVVPGGTTSTWTSQTGLNGVGNITARINLLAVSKEDWILGPKFTATSASQITFDAAITGVGALTTYSAMGSDDMVRVMVSTDCGTTYAPIFTVSATNSLTSTFTNFVVSLSAYAGQDIIVGFLATDGPVNDIESYDFHLDNINIYNPVANDAGVSALVTPGTIGCYGASENVAVTLNNYGSNAISNIPVTVIVSGAVSQTINATYTGTIAPSATANFTVGTLNMTTAGTYSFDASTGLVGDGNTSNDNMVQVTRTQVAPVSVPQSVDFTGFTGANLNTVFPNWGEAAGAPTPGGTTSLWTTQTGLNGVGNITARINLYTTTRNEWIVGPKITAGSSSQITFDAAVTDWNSTTVAATMGSDDMVRVMVSTDCGVTYAPIYTLSVTNSLTTTFTNFTVSLGAYAGQDIIVAFYATDGPVNDIEDYDFHLDNINICTTPSAPSSPVATGICTGTTATISSGAVSGTPYWYNVPTGGTVVSTSTVYTTPTLTANTTYYVADSTGCGIGPRTPVTITVSPVPSLTVSTSDTVLCLGNTATLTVTGATTYSWTGVGAGSSVVVTPTATTVYTVTGSNTGCDATTTINQVVSACTGIENTLVNSNGINLFPNPTQGDVTIIVSNVTEGMKLEVYDAVGKRIMIKSLNENRTTLSLSELESGIYVYKIYNVNGAVKVGKLIKE
ncbi:MAG: T9SS type A sorting domain-containing protein [Bacteroidetes bacterium]|nr:T9SS type A sorting domain-containing protein [Bacteroidota bacterium]